MLATRPTVRAYYVLSVRQFAVLPPPSFRPVLADDPLDLANSSDCRACSGLSPYRFCPCWAHNHLARVRKDAGGDIILMYIQAYVSHAAFASCFSELVSNAVLLKQYSIQDECTRFHLLVIFERSSRSGRFFLASCEVEMHIQPLLNIIVVGDFLKRTFSSTLYTNP